MLEVVFPPSCIHCLLLYPFTQVTANVCLHNAGWPSRLLSSAWGVFVIFIQFIAPMIIMIYCYGRIVWLLTRKIDTNLGTKERSTTDSQGVLSKRFLAARNNTIKTFLLVGICFFICWVNDEVYYLMFNLGYEADWNSTYFKFCLIMVFLNCTVNPFVYLIKYQDYQKALKELFCSKRRHPDDRSQSFTGTTEISTIT